MTAPIVNGKQDYNAVVEVVACVLHSAKNNVWKRLDYFVTITVQDESSHISSIQLTSISLQEDYNVKLMFFGTGGQRSGWAKDS